MVVASKRSSTCAVFELSVLASRTSNSVPTGISLALDERPVVPTRLLSDAGGEDDGRSSPMPVADGVDRLLAASPRARSRMLSMRSRISEYSLREIDSFLRSLTFR
jgi:hypothetical protein